MCLEDKGNRHYNREGEEFEVITYFKDYIAPTLIEMKFGLITKSVKKLIFKLTQSLLKASRVC